ncbi:hypothetical protein [Pseudomonas putida]
MNSIEERLAQLERRVAQLEGQGASPRTASEPTPVPPPSHELPIEVQIFNKRHAPANPDQGVFEDHIWFDCTFTLAAESVPTRAVKGFLEFSDLFGEIKFRVQATVNEPLMPQAPLQLEGIGFSYNPFMADHQWMLGTRLEDMQCGFKVAEVLFTDEVR